MPYALHTLDIENLPDSLALGTEENGFALVVRHRGRPAGMVMEPGKPGEVVGRGRLEALVAKAAGTSLLEQRALAALAAGEPAPPPLPVTACICTKDHPDLVERCLAALTALPEWVAEDRTTFRILVVDNAPSDGATAAVVARFPGVDYAMEPRPGLDFARNKAIAASRDGLLAYVDDDAVVTPGWLAGLRRAWADNPDAGGFTGLVLPFALETEAQVLFERRGGFGRGYRRIRHMPVDPRNRVHPCGAGTFGAGCNMAFPREVLIALGGFDEALDTGRPLPGGGDLDIFYRVVRSGRPLVYDPDYALAHEHRKDMAGLKRQYWTWGQGFMAFVTKSRRSDPAARRRFSWLIFWWLRHQGRELARALRGKGDVPVGMVVAELRGAVTGILGEYDRSLRRTAEIRRRFP
ncbi:glycosyltransferase [Aerophototrophica crusticola]|uniref:Glycosyltransferase n=1 Tax=Aerophototrophica crusticola TaxID=1709002 RepID=A0A858R7N9_9PROT|nr:glycosyltransferase [Rhodospirillaceae bacterium B3]